jgi:hypothetical protein
MKNKKGDLLPEETLKIVIAVICIGFLVFLLVSLYFSATGQDNKKKAEESMILISREITRVNSGESFNEQGIFVPNPNDWFILSFIGEETKPNMCAGNNCLCICENVAINPFNWRDKAQLKRCDDKGVCFFVSNLKKFDKLKIEKSGIALIIRKVNSEIQITRK